MKRIPRLILSSILTFAGASAMGQTQDHDAAALQSMDANQRSTQRSVAADHSDSDRDDDALAQHDADEAAAQEEYRQQQASQTAQGDEGDICGVILCMAGSTSSVAPHECKPYVQRYFEVRVYKRRKFRPVQTAARRYEKVLNACPDAEPQQRDRINAMFGMLEYSPFLFN